MNEVPAPAARPRRAIPRLRLCLLILLSGVLLVQTAAVVWGLITIAGHPVFKPGAAIGSDWVQNGDGWQLSRIRRDGGIRIRGVEEAGPAYVAGLRDGDLIVTVNGRSVMDHPGEWFRARLWGNEGDSLHVAWLREGAEMTGAIVLGPRGGGRSVQSTQGRAYFSLPYRAYCWVIYGDLAVLYALLLLVGATVGFFGLRDDRAFWFAFLFLGLGIATFAPQTVALVALWPLWFLATLGLVSAVVTILFGWIALRTFAVFPRPSRLGIALLRWQWLALLIGATGAFWALKDGADLFPALRPAAASLSWLGLGGAPQVLFLLMIIALLVAQRAEARGEPERRVKVIELGFDVIGLGLALSLLGQLKDALGLWKSFTAYVVLWYAGFVSLLFVVIGLSLVAYGVLARRVFGVRFVLRRGLQHLLLSRGVLLIEAFAVFLLIEEMLRRSGAQVARSVPFVAGLSMATGAVFLAGLRRASRPLMERIDRRFFAEVHDARRVLLDVGQTVSTLRSAPEVIETSGRAILSALHPERAAVCLLPSGSEEPKQVWIGCGRDRAQVRPQLVDDAASAALIPGKTLDALRAGRSWADLLDDSDGAEDLTDGTGDPNPRRPPAPSVAGWELAIPVRSGEELLGCLALTGKLSEEPYSREDRELLLAVATQMGLALKNLELLEVARREAQQARDIEIACRVQQGLFPKELPSADGWELAAFCRPARAVGGDYYDVFEAAPGLLAVALGDVSGKGLGASLLMANLHALVRSRLPQELDDLGALMAGINDHLYVSTPPEMFATLLLGLLEVRTGRFRFVNAGHPPPFLLCPESGSRDPLSGGGIPAGMMPGMPFSAGEIVLDWGDALVIYSDGVTEAVDPRGALFGETALDSVLDDLVDRLSQAALDDPAAGPADGSVGRPADGQVGRATDGEIGGAADGPVKPPGGANAAERILSTLVDQVDRFVAGVEQADDISVTVVRRAIRA